MYQNCIDVILLGKLFIITAGPFLCCFCCLAFRLLPALPGLLLLLAHPCSSTASPDPIEALSVSCDGETPDLC